MEKSKPTFFPDKLEIKAKEDPKDAATEQAQPPKAPEVAVPEPQPTAVQNQPPGPQPDAQLGNPQNVAPVQENQIVPPQAPNSGVAPERMMAHPLPENPIVQPPLAADVPAPVQLVPLVNPQPVNPALQPAPVDNNAQADNPFGELEVDALVAATAAAVGPLPAANPDPQAAANPQAANNPNQAQGNRQPRQRRAQQRQPPNPPPLPQPAQPQPEVLPIPVPPPLPKYSVGRTYAFSLVYTFLLYFHMGQEDGSYKYLQINIAVEVFTFFIAALVALLRVYNSNAQTINQLWKNLFELNLLSSRSKISLVYILLHGETQPGILRISFLAYVLYTMFKSINGKTLHSYLVIPYFGPLAFYVGYNYWHGTNVIDVYRDYAEYYCIGLLFVSLIVYFISFNAPQSNMGYIAPSTTYDSIKKEMENQIIPSKFNMLIPLSYMVLFLKDKEISLFWGYVGFKILVSVNAFLGFAGFGIWINLFKQWKRKIAHDALPHNRRAPQPARPAVIVLPAQNAQAANPAPVVPVKVPKKSPYEYSLQTGESYSFEVPNGRKFDDLDLVCTKCKDSKANCVILPCKHPGICHNCVLNQLREGEIECFECKKPLTKIVRVTKGKNGIMWIVRDEVTIRNTLKK